MKRGFLIKLITRNSLLVTCCLLLVTALLAGCGAGPGSPGSSGTEDTGVLVDAMLVPTYNTANTSSVDVVQVTCDAGPPAVIEYFADHSAALTLTARLLNPTTTFPVGTLYIERYTVEFRRSTDSISAPPIETDTRYGTIAITPPTGTATTTVTATVILVDLKRKAQYLTDVLSGQYTSNILNNYTATYTFYGKNQYNAGFSFKASTNFQIGSFNNCA